jgi:phage-related protein
MTYTTFDNIKLDLVTNVKRSQRVQRIQFGDGYTQVLSDGLNSEMETWSCKTVALTNEEIFSTESFLLSKKGNPISWTPPYNTKNFSRPFESGKLILGYNNLSSVALAGYTRPSNYTANLATGVLTSVTIANDTVVDVTLSRAPGDYLIQGGWSINLISPIYSTIEFELVRVYV